MTHEMKLLLETIFLRYGLDFRDCAPSYLKHRIWKIISEEQLLSISNLKEKILQDKTYMEKLLHTFTITTTSFFRDPEVYLVFRQKVIPLLKTCPSIRIWHAGCATGEEVYSLAIVLWEEGLYPICKIHATDLDEIVVNLPHLQKWGLQGE